jgi:DNA transformation protein
MATSNEYLQFVLEQLAGLGRVAARRMFGGTGLYLDEVFFGLISRDTLYFKVDDTTREHYFSRGMEAFRPFRDKPKSSLSYYAVPADVLEEPEHLVEWARGALTAATAGRRVRRRRASE